MLRKKSWIPSVGCEEIIWILKKDRGKWSRILSNDRRKKITNYRKIIAEKESWNVWKESAKIRQIMHEKSFLWKKNRPYLGAVWHNFLVKWSIFRNWSRCSIAEKGLLHLRKNCYSQKFSRPTTEYHIKV